jgi:hypothetical protein
MTARLRRRTRRRKSDDVSHVVASFWRHRNTDLGTLTAHLLGQTRVREVVAVALLLEKEYRPHLNSRFPSDPVRHTVDKRGLL